MRSCLSFLLAGMLLCHSSLVGRAAEDSLSEKELGDVLVQFTPATHYIWTDKLVYTIGEAHTLRWTAAPNNDPYPYTIFVYRENIVTGDRIYLPNLSADVSDVFGNAPGNFQPVTVPDTSKQVLVSGPVPNDPGNYHFVAELRDATGTRVVKGAWAKFAVVDEIVSFGASDTEISQDTTWVSTKAYRVTGQVFVNAGATLTIEPGTHVLARGQNAVIVVENEGRMVADGTRARPIVMTCDSAVGLRESGCWAGLIVPGRAPVNSFDPDNPGERPKAEGVQPPTRPVYGGTDADDDSGVYRYLRVEFAGVDFAPDIQPNAFGFHGVGAGTVIDHIQAPEGEDDGIEFFGGTVNGKYMVSDGSKDDSVDWAEGWIGYLQLVFILQDNVEADRGIEADNWENGFNAEPRSMPKI